MMIGGPIASRLAPTGYRAARMYIGGSLMLGLALVCILP